MEIQTLAHRAPCRSGELDGYKVSKVDDFFADFVGYFFESTKELFKGSVSNGNVRLDTVSNGIELVLTHLDGRGDPQQTRLRTAAVKRVLSQTPLPNTPVTSFRQKTRQVSTFTPSIGSGSRPQGTSSGFVV